MNSTILKKASTVVATKPTKNFCIFDNRYSILPNRHVYTFISGKVCPLASIKVKRQTLPEINIHVLLFGTLEYVPTYFRELTPFFAN